MWNDAHLRVSHLGWFLLLWLNIETRVIINNRFIIINYRWQEIFSFKKFYKLKAQQLSASTLNSPVSLIFTIFFFKFASFPIDRVDPPNSLGHIRDAKLHVKISQQFLNPLILRKGNKVMLRIDNIIAINYLLFNKRSFGNLKFENKNCSTAPRVRSSEYIIVVMKFCTL